jgi:hypothetical protein
MIARLLGAATSVVAYFLAATLVAQVILGGYLWHSWKMDGDRALQMLAIAQGIDLFAARADHDALDEDEPGPEQPSLEQLIAARTAKDRDLSVRELSLKSGAEESAFLQRELAAKQNDFKRLTENYETQLAETIEGEKAVGREQVRAALETIKATQAKSLLLAMLEKDEIDEVVLILGQMQPRPQAKIMAEFKTPEELSKLDEIMRLIREGEPKTGLAQQAVNQLTPPTAIAP